MVFTRYGGVWQVQGNQLIGSASIGPSQQGYSVAISADGNTALVGGFQDNDYIGAAWVFTRSGGVWSQQGEKLVGSGADPYARQGYRVALSADGNTALVGGLGDAWVFTRIGQIWTQQGAKLSVSPCCLGFAAALSADGNTALIGGFNTAGMGWPSVFTRSGDRWTQQGGMLQGSDAISPTQGWLESLSVALSADGNTALVGWPNDNAYLGATWVFARSGGVWNQQGSKLVGSSWVKGPAPNNVVYQGASVALSADGNTALVGGDGDDNFEGASWVFRRSGGVWTQEGNKLIGSRVSSGDFQGASVALSADGYTALIGSFTGSAWVFTSPKPSTATVFASVNPSLFGQSVTYTAKVTAGATGTVTFTVDGVAQSTVALNANQAQFTISNLSPGNHTISAAYSGDATFAPSTSNVVNQIVTPLGVISLWANTIVALGQSGRVPVSLAKPAPAAGLTIYLSSSDPSKVTVTPSVFIPGGRTAPAVQPQVNGLNLGTVSLSATALGYTPSTQTVEVTATLAFARCCVAVYGTTTAVLTLSSAAPSGLTINLVSDNPKVATVPATITFPPQVTSVGVPITGTGSGTTLIHASALPNLAGVSVKVTVP
ncbi:MAG TPA: Ig-like domain-containing protein [Bryobacteraceae bacterium]|nr:Ig-like domain-containing protein [Bryobacteraceae bacterium]